MKCPKCGYPVLPKYANCPKCGTNLKAAAPSPVTAPTTPPAGEGNDLQLVRGRAIWNIQVGEVAHVVRESELAGANDLKGIIVPEGCSAMIYVDGQMVSVMQSGTYTFPKEEKKPEEASAPKNEESKPQSFVNKFLASFKKDEKPEMAERRRNRIREKAERLKVAKTCRVYYVSNRLINVIFNSKTTEDGKYVFEPLTIASKTFDVNVAVSLQLQVTNMAELVKNYLTDRQTLTVLDLQQLLLPTVQATLAQLLRNLDYQQDGLPEPIVNNLKKRLVENCNGQLAGIEVVKALDVTDSSTDFDRFRTVERKLFVSEVELGFMQRTNEFRNRLEQEKNKSEVAQAQNAEALRQSLQAINKDKLLSEDEMEQFVLMVDSQKRLREAKTKEEEYEALSDLKKSRLVKEDEVATLENTLAQGKISRDNVADLMRVQAEHKLALSRQIAEFELSDNQQDHEMARQLEEAQHKGKLTAIQLETKRHLDDYQDERRQKDDDYAFVQQQRKDEYDFAQQQKKDEYGFAQQQRQREADFKARMQNESFDYKMQQLQDERSYANLQRDLEMRKQNEDYDFEKRKRNDEQQFVQDQRKFQTRVLNEDYDFQKMQREQALKEQQTQADYARERQSKMDDLDALERKAAIAQRNMQTMKDAEMAELKEKNRSAETLHSMDLNVEMNRDNLFANMTAEQIRAAQLSHLSSEAQAEMARSYGSEKEKALYEQMLQNQMAQSAQNQEMMMKMAQMMQQGMMGMGQQQMAAQQQRYDDQVAMKQEYREMAERQQMRTDHAQDSAMENIGRVSAAAAGNVSAFGAGRGTPQMKKCPCCGAEVPTDEAFCTECGSRV